jgi:hypothetical protein
MIRTLLALGLLALSPVLRAQDTAPSPCATHQTEEDLSWLRSFQADPEGTAERLGLDLRRSGSDLLVPVKVHILGNDDGVGYYRLDQLIGSFCNLNERFDSTGFHFYILGDINYVDNDNWYVHDFFQGGNMMAALNVPGAVNMYFVSDPAGACGYYSPFRDAVAIAKSCAGITETTITHEMGHFFSLPHTFYGWEDGTPPLSQQEGVNGSNCTTAADGFCDTPPDYAPYRWNCPSTGPFTDPNGEVFTPDGTLYMSYSNDACTERFSPLQRLAMRANLAARGVSGLPTGGPEPVDLGATTLVEPDNGALELPYNYTVLKWDEVPGATGYLVTVALNSTMNAVVQEAIVGEPYWILPELATNRRHYWRVQAITPSSFCAPASEVRIFTTGETFSGLPAEDGPLRSLAAWPNPLPAGAELRLDLGLDRALDGTARIVDLLGRTVAARPLALPAGNQRLTWSVPDLAPGTYAVVLSAAEGRWSTPLIVR